MKSEFWKDQDSLPVPGRTSGLRKRIGQIPVATQNTPTLTTPKSRNHLITNLSSYLLYLMKDSTSHVEVNSSETHLILDTGIDLKKLGLKLSNSRDFSENVPYLVLNKDQPLQIFISVTENPNHLNLTFLPNYTYWDHIQDLSFFTWAFITDNRLTSIDHNDEQLHQPLKYQQHTPNYFPIPLEGISANMFFHSFPKNKFQLNDLTMSTSSLSHPGNNFVFRLHQGNQNVVYITDYKLPNDDTNESNHFIEFIIEANIIISNAQYPYLENMTRKSWDLSSSFNTVDLPLKARVNFFLLFHHDLEYSDLKLSIVLKKINLISILSETIGQCDRPMQIELAIKGLTLEV